jgi:hypothetical protein
MTSPQSLCGTCQHEKSVHALKGLDVGRVGHCLIGLDLWEKSPRCPCTAFVSSGETAETAVLRRAVAALEDSARRAPQPREAPQERIANDDAFAQSFDAMEWAEAFCRRVDDGTFTRNGGIDRGLMVGWFANALMRGFDEHAQRSSPREAESRERIAGFAKMLADCDAANKNHPGYRGQSIQPSYIPLEADDLRFLLDLLSPASVTTQPADEMSPTEDRRAIQSVDCRECGAAKGEPCRYSRGPIKGVHAKRVLYLREIERPTPPTERHQ